jgi:SprT protein
MKKQETEIGVLKQFLPPGTFSLVAPFFRNHVIHLTLTHERKTVLGDYRHPTRATPYHRISVNVNLNPYSFLITLLHELAHMLTFVHFRHTVSPHGKEWKTQFRHVLLPFIGKGFFPKDVEKALMAYLNNPAASTCTDPNLFKALYSYDERKPGYRLVDELKPGQRFMIEDGRVFEKLETLRTRARCKELRTGRLYFFQGIVEVKMLRS